MRIYFFDSSASDKAIKVKPSSRGELEITSIMNMYLEEKNLFVKPMSRGFSWLDTGTHTSLLDAGNFVKSIQNRQGLQVGCPEEIAFKNGWISREDLIILSRKYDKTDYGQYLKLLSMGS